MITDDKLKLISIEFQRQKKDVITAYILCVFFWFAGVHKFYVLKFAEGIFYILANLSASVSLVLGVFYYGFNTTLIKLGFSLFAVVVLFLLYDIVTLWRQVEKANNKIYSEIFEKIAGVPYH